MNKVCTYCQHHSREKQSQEPALIDIKATCTSEIHMRVVWLLLLGITQHKTIRWIHNVWRKFRVGSPHPNKVEYLRVCT